MSPPACGRRHGPRGQQPPAVSPAAVEVTRRNPTPPDVVKPACWSPLACVLEHFHAGWKFVYPSRSCGRSASEARRVRVLSRARPSPASQGLRDLSREGRERCTRSSQRENRTVADAGHRRYLPESRLAQTHAVDGAQGEARRAAPPAAFPTVQEITLNRSPTSGRDTKPSGPVGRSPPTVVRCTMRCSFTRGPSTGPK